eukprot:CAMPEP_0182877896 /NCGR_PEP_ID=MMETSP0034_2-20130328/15035_1 /TAXON_ID=156128 /ORGANISM="Nephroselmis pyriformis, Strain CCMP717" /LENGTH=167 /DNA_ID=CAMNT_0025010763 /DNA_START=14 /DNA_END=513 /DNA_ORIENTATION=+
MMLLATSTFALGGAIAPRPSHLQVTTYLPSRRCPAPTANGAGALCRLQWGGRGRDASPAIHVPPVVPRTVAVRAAGEDADAEQAEFEALQARAEAAALRAKAQEIQDGLERMQAGKAERRATSSAEVRRLRVRAEKLRAEKARRAREDSDERRTVRIKMESSARKAA